MKRLIRIIFSLLSLQLFALVAVAQQQQFASIGDLKLQNGGVIRNCRIGYRTFGKLNADKSNIIVFPTWAGGTTEQPCGHLATVCEASRLDAAVAEFLATD